VDLFGFKKTNSYQRQKGFSDEDKLYTNFLILGAVLVRFSGSRMLRVFADNVIINFQKSLSFYLKARKEK